ncbi:hypothetical protein CARUB_v10015895mg [Capsella rubella]|uniref:Uncharacterized protein n=1 Tax=Capsella rubella TaxID=81985 RepID=R0GA83_9BRAS|nr:uncharacterized protein LOC17893301 [Capsella rubella]EOA32602.1 hypothetical protein CARUB_v10015895mg [Capsella rubella]
MDQIKPEFLKNLTKFILLSIWVVSLLVTHNFYLYRFTIQLVTHAVDKNYMFLLCNGLLMVVAKCSGLVATASKPVETKYSTSNTDHKSFDYRDFKSYGTILELEHYSSSVHHGIGGGGTESFLAEEVTVQEDNDDTTHQEAEMNEEGEDNDDSLADNDDGEEEWDLRDGFINEEEEEEENVELLAATEEEMNKKFDEFIRKMKEELRIEAKRHLILV